MAFRPWKITRQQLAKRVRRALIANAALAVTFPGAPLLAHDHEHPELTPWYKSLKSGNGPCCDGSDAVHLTDVDWDMKDNHYRVRLEGQWVDVPPEAVVQGPNHDGRTLVWPYYLNGRPNVRCFMPGAET